MNFFRKNLSLNRRSQIAVIITFVIAVILLFIAAFINISKVSQVKTTTSTASDRAALGLASQLGSMSHYYKDKVLKISGSCATPPCQACSTDWVSLGVLVGIVVAIGLTIIPTLGASLIALPLAIVISTSILSGISSKYKEMTGYNAFRESALFQALRDTQSDDVEVKAKPGSPGYFYEDTNNNGVFDVTTESEYNLSTIPEMRNEKKVSRFAAWYYFLRLPLVDDGDMKTSLENIFLDRLKNFIDVDKWDSSKWKINKLSYVIRSDSSISDRYDVTCSGSSCPDWVKDAATGQLRMIRMDASDIVSGGFLKDKLNSSSASGGLLNRLQNSYSSSKIFCNEADCKIKPSDVNNLIEDLREFLLRSKEVLNMPVSTRFTSLMQWFSLWYDFEHHCDNRWFKDSEGNCIDPTSDSYLNDHYKDDIYLRLTRDQVYINRWITELETLNNTATTGIKDVIKAEHGHNEFGAGDPRSSCATEACCGWDCQTLCCTPADCSFAGIYCTACGGERPPVCVNRDLYGAKPDWCPLGSRSASCACSCSISPQCSGICQFQGQLSWRTPDAGRFDGTNKPTEVEQAIRILRSLYDDIAKIKMSIGDLADKVGVYLFSGEPYTDTNNNGVYDPYPAPGEPYTDLNHNSIYDSVLPETAKRNVIVYAWKNKPDAAGKQYVHFVQVKIDGYPKNLPNITESIEWGGIIPQKCRQLNDYQGDLTITTWRYDQDQPTDIGWKLKRRKTPSADEFSPAQLEGIVADIQDNGQIDSTQSYIDTILTGHAIKSTSKAHYGPLKSDIRITDTSQ